MRTPDATAQAPRKSSGCPKCLATRGILQTKLTIGEPGDVFEQEADRIADQVLAQPPYPDVSSAPPRIHRYAEQAAAHADTAPASVDHVLAGSGRPLEPALRQDMEQRFGQDFSDVRVHSGAAAEQSAREVHASAYTVGRDIVFGAHRFAPATHEGRRLIAHELTHVLQQRTVSAPSGNGMMQATPASGRTLQRQPAAAGRREARITVVFDEDHVEFYHRVIRAIQRSAGLRNLKVSFGQPFYDPILAIHRRLALSGTKTGSRLALRASVFFDPAEFHEELTGGRLELEQEARLRETKVTGVIVPADNFAGRSLTRLGLAEVTNLSFAASPAATAGELGGLKWDLYKGGGTLVPSASDDGTAVFTAPATPGPIGLDLLVASGLAAGRRVATLNLRSVAPDDALMEQVPGSPVAHDHGKCGAITCGRVFLRPVDVSFMNLAFTEGDGIAKADGYYESSNGAPHCKTNLCYAPWTVTGGNSTTGCKVWMVDRFGTGSRDPPFAKGTFLWPIDWMYRVGTGPWVKFTVADQTAVADGTGRATIAKKGSKPVSADAADPTTTVDCGTLAI